MSFYRLDPPYDPYNEDEPDQDTGEFQCPCGDEHCRGYNDDPALIRIGKTFYASDCVLANAHPEVVRERALDAQRDTRRGK